MKPSSVLSLLLFPVALFSQQSSVSGVVAIQNSQYERGKIEYVSNAEVEEAFGKGRAVTDANGQFRLVLVGIGDKESVRFDVLKDGYEVVNHDQLQAVAGQKESLKIYMASQRYIVEAKRRYYNTGYTNAEKGLKTKLAEKEQELASLQGRTGADQQKIAGLEGEIQQLQQEFSKLDQFARELSEKYARINLDDVSTLYQDAFRQFQEGDMDEALKLLQNAHLEERVEKRVAEKERIERLREEAAEAEALNQKGIEEDIRTLRLKADLHRARYEWDSIEYCYDLLLRLNDKNLYALDDIAKYLTLQNKLDKSLAVYEKCLAACTNASDSNAVMHNMAISYQIKRDYKRAEEMYLAVLKFKKDKEFKSGWAENGYAMTLNNLGMIYERQGKYSEALKMNEEALEIRRRLAAEQPYSRYEDDLAVTLLNLGIVYMGLKQYSEAEKAYLENNEILKKLYRWDKSDENGHALVRSLNNLGYLYRETNQFDRSEAYFLEGEVLAASLYKINPLAYGPSFSLVKNNLGILYRDQKDDVRAEKYFLEEQSIQKELYAASAEAFGPDLASTHLDLGNLYRRQKQFDLSETYYRKAERLYREALKNGLSDIGTKLDLSTTLNNLGLLYDDDKQYVKSEKAYLEAMEIRRELAKNDAVQYEDDVATTLNSLGVLYDGQGQLAKAESYYSEALAIRERRVGIDKDSTELERVRNNLRYVYYAMVDSAATYAEKVAVQQKAIKSFEQSMKTAPNDPRLKEDYARELSNLAWFSLFIEDFKGAEKACKKAFDIDPATEVAYGNLLMAYLYQGDWKNAEAIYSKYKDKLYQNERPWKTIFLQDLQDLEAAGIQHPDAAKVRALLGQ